MLQGREAWQDLLIIPGKISQFSKSFKIKYMSLNYIVYQLIVPNHMALKDVFCFWNLPAYQIVKQGNGQYWEKQGLVYLPSKIFP